MNTDERRGRASAGGFTGVTRGLWVEEPAVRYRMPDPVRTAAVRAVIVMAVTLVEAMVALLATLADSWLAFRPLIASIASTVGTTWAVLDVWVTRQVFNQRHGVVSVPSSTARRLRRERRAARRAVREARREEDRAARAAERRRASGPDRARAERSGRRSHQGPRSAALH
ncbi:hypothetical protein [Streptomyces sp. 8L]|uniref:hypothetical protein n=1 Tax=Streptomyces sp. 8L TaxID=2877242 RepID=UPI001CD59CF5|nr:hypothetical protein [Streptomyces sp. 8L]MCA1221040.1 hypothetical protein [Streptomyces sp. 8L]